MIRRLLVPAGAAAVLLVAAACGQQTDDRVDTTATDAGTIASEVAAATPYVTLDCVSLQGMPVDAPPSGGTTLGAATAIFQPNGAPAITIATDNQPATALGSAQLNTQQFFLTPDQRSKTLRIRSLPEARFIGIMAEYQALDGKVWRLSLPVPEGDAPAFWAFWKRNDGELNARIVAGVNGLRVEKQ